MNLPSRLDTPPIPGWRPEPLFDRFSRVVSAQADRVAVTGRPHITYRELYDRAQELARQLHRRGARRGDRIGIMMGRSVDTIIAMIAIVRLGATYVPLDPAYPQQRLTLIREDARLGIVLTDAGLDDVPLADEFPPSDSIDPQTPAYIIYTSGSSGRPKGVEVPQSNVSALIAATEGDFALVQSDVWTWFHSESFDVSVWEIWGCLLTGGRLVVVPPWICRSPSDFLALLRREGVTVLNQTPSAFSPLLDQSPDMVAELAVRLIILGGEPLDTTMLRRWFDVSSPSSCRIINMYGITETTVHVTAQDVTGEAAAHGSRLVGLPIPGWTVCVVDEQRRVVPRGQTGEIAVGGFGVAAGYLNRPELTAERFAPNEHGQLFYFSGDQGRMHDDGRLEHLGRIDSQVKLRGYRIELDEIRTTLLRHRTVTASAVIVIQANLNAETAALHGFVVLAHGEPETVMAELHTYLTEELPAYMIPATLTAIPALPLTSNGKLDAAALANMRHLPEVAIDTPNATGTQRCIQAVWSDILGFDVALDSNFFDIGGNSIAAARVVRVLREHGYAITVYQLYTHPTVEQLAELLEGPQQNATTS